MHNKFRGIQILINSTNSYLRRTTLIYRERFNANTNQQQLIYPCIRPINCPSKYNQVPCFYLMRSLPTGLSHFQCKALNSTSTD
ncbi:hypothetical protein FGO68_gene2239 [Halteria grandinella]|uniref:Uncharacterized protein n=1 Tax=Halteria grandinella TaxID=5974 RepID=A0A8J8NIH2_HALGN|nr:hypothetical protein FGO68_gene2239 [Halteria grandinella]